MYRCLIILFSILGHIICDCLYPQWKQTCQKYCMDNQLYEIQLNQCYSMDPNQLTCKCSGQILTEKIKNIIESKNSSPLSTKPTIPENMTCIPSHSCTIGKKICNGINAYCTCDNGTWINILCPKGNICKTESCQTTSNEPISLVSMSGLASSIVINEYFSFFLFLFVNSQK